MLSQKKVYSAIIRRLVFAMALLVVSIATTSAQTQMVSLEAGEMTIQEIFSSIEQQTGFMFVIRNQGFDVSEKVAPLEGKTSVNELLELVLAGTDKTWLADGKYIIIPIDKPVEENKTGSISGTIYDHNGRDPVVGASVELVGSDIRTISGNNGRYLLTDIPATTYIVKFTAANGISRYREINVRAGQRTTVDMVFTARDFTVPDQRPELLLDTNPVKAPGSYEQPTEEVIMPDPGTYTIVNVGRTARSYQPKTALKTNLLYWATTTPNVGLEFYLAKHWSLNAHFGYNSWKRSGDRGALHWLVQPEGRYWFCNVFERSFIGLHGIYGKFNIQDFKLPLTNTFERGHHYRGHAYGGGVSWGYHLPLARRWGMEFSVGVGYVYTQYDKYRCGNCDQFEGRYYKHYFGPTKAAVSMIFMVN